MYAVGYFVKKTEKYLRETFNCAYSQLMLVDHVRQGLYSFDVRNKRARLLRRGQAYDEYSITNAMIKGSFLDPIIWPGTTEQLNGNHI